MYQTDNCHVCVIGSKPATNKSIRRLCARKKKNLLDICSLKEKKKGLFPKCVKCFPKVTSVRLENYKTGRIFCWITVVRLIRGESWHKNTDGDKKKKKKLVNNRQDIFFSWAVRLKDPVFSHKKDWAVKECVYPLVNIDAFFLPTDQKGLVNVWERKRVTDQSTQLHHRCIVM